MKMFLGGMKQYHFFKENKMFKLQYNTLFLCMCIVFLSVSLLLR